MENNIKKKAYNYNKIKIVCQGIIQSCEFCKSVNEEDSNGHSIREGYCAKCGRPLWKKPGDKCGYIVGYADRGFENNKKERIHIKCKFCNTLTSV